MYTQDPLTAFFEKKLGLMFDTFLPNHLVALCESQIPNRK
jgi:hypothetical protein